MLTVCSSTEQRHCAIQHCCHHQPRREQRHKHCSHCSVKNRIHSLVAMEALEGTAMAAEIDPDLISKIRARHVTRNRRAQPAETTAKRGADFRSM
jgi:hypothetical protein